MNPRFKPLITEPAEDNGDARPFQLKIVPSGSTATPFKPLSSILAAVSSGSAGGTADADPDGQVDAQLETRRQGDQITRIIVTCNCGRLHEIECEY